MELDYSNRRVRSINQLSESDLAHAGKVTELILNDNPITNFSGLEKFKKLRRLSLNNTRIKVFPSEILELNMLNSLSCQDNLIKDIPKWIGKLTALKMINLGANEIEEVPLIFEKLKSLEELYLDYNKIDSLSGEVIHQLSQLKKLHVFEIKGNNIPPDQHVILNSESNQEKDSSDNEPSTLVSASKRLDLLSEYYKGPMGPLNQVKVVILGGGGVGKSTLVEALLTGIPPENTISTTSVNINEWEPEVYIQGGAVKATIWDFGGQQIFHDISKIFLSDDTIYVILDDVQTADRDPKHGTKYWLRHIDIMTKGERKSPVIVAFHRADTEGVESYVEDLTTELYRDFGVTTCICTSKERPDTLIKFRQILRDQIRIIAQRRPAIPLYFIKTRDKLSEFYSPYITRKKLRRILREAKAETNGSDNQNEVEDFELDKCIEFLHRIGAIVKFADTIKKMTYVLDPKWLVEGIYKIFNSSYVRRERGRFTLDLVMENVDFFRDNEAYDEIGLQVIIDIMLAFRLTFEVSRKHHGEQRNYLIPTHLGRKPDDHYLLSVDALRLRLNYYLSNEQGKDHSEHTRSVLARFICEQYADIDPVNLFRDYCCLTLNNHLIEIFIVTQSGEKEIEIRVKGSETAQVMAIYLDQVRNVNFYFKADAKTMIPVRNEKDYWFAKDTLDAYLKADQQYFLLPDIGEKVEVRKILKPYSTEQKSLNIIDLQIAELKNNIDPVHKIRMLLLYKAYECDLSAESLARALRDGDQEAINILECLFDAQYKPQEELGKGIKLNKKDLLNFKHIIRNDFVRTETHLEQYEAGSAEWLTITKYYLQKLAEYGAAEMTVTDELNSLANYFHFLLGKTQQSLQLNDRLTYSIHPNQSPCGNMAKLRRLGEAILALLSHEICLSWKLTNQPVESIHFEATNEEEGYCIIKISRCEETDPLEESASLFIEKTARQQNGVFEQNHTAYWLFTFYWP